MVFITFMNPLKSGLDITRLFPGDNKINSRVIKPVETMLPTPLIQMPHLSPFHTFVKTTFYD